MWFVSIVLRIFFVAAIASIPLFVEQPKVWLTVFCLFSAWLILRFAMHDPETLIRRALPPLAIGFLSLLSWPGLQISEKILPHAAARTAINGFLQFFEVSNTLAVIFLIIFLSMVGLEAWRMYLSNKKHQENINLKEVPGNSRIIKDALGYTVETRICITNNGSSQEAVKHVEILAFGFIKVDAEMWRVKEAITDLYPNEVILISPREDKLVHVVASFNDKNSLKISKIFDICIFKCIPIPFRLGVRDAQLTFTAKVC